MGAIGTVGMAVSVLPESTWAARPSAVGRTRQRIKITDFDAWFVSNGTRWYPESGEVTVSVSKTDVTSQVALTTACLVAKAALPAGLVAAGCEIHVDRVWDIAGTSAKVEKVWLSTSTVNVGDSLAPTVTPGVVAQFSTLSLSTSAATSAQLKNVIHVSGASANSQFSLGATASNTTPYANMTNAATSSAIETQSAASYINLCLSKATAADSAVLKAFKVMIKF